MKAIIIIQKYIRRYLVYKKILIPSAYYQTKMWRLNQSWYKNGKINECEKYQISLIEKILKLKIVKTYERINIETNEILNISNKSLNNSNGYEFTENFDGKIIKDCNIYYFNLKFVCDNGGAQTRTLREVYHFIKYQLYYLIKFNSINIYFINILDGDTCYKNMNKFTYLLNKKENKYVFIGSLYEFKKYYYK